MNFSPSELQFLDDDNKSQMSQASTISTASAMDKPDRNGNRLIASVLVLATLGIGGVGLNGAFANTCMPCLSLMVLFFSILVYEWQRYHGITLSRKLRPVVNMSSVFATYKHLDPDSACLFPPADKDKYYKWACCNVPEINTELPRTADERS